MLLTEVPKAVDSLIYDSQGNEIKSSKANKKAIMLKF